MGFKRDGCRISYGSIRFDGTELVGGNEEVSRELRGNRIANVAQSAAASFNPAHRLLGQCIEASVYRHVLDRAVARRDATSPYRQMQLPDPEQTGFRYPHQVSGGQLRRAMTAMAMTSRPDLTIFDEPTTALEVTAQIEGLATIRNIVDAYDTAAIYITDDLAVVTQMADPIKVLLRGEEVEQTETRQMVEAPSHDYTRSL